MLGQTNVLSGGGGGDSKDRLPSMTFDFSAISIKKAYGYGYFGSGITLGGNDYALGNVITYDMGAIPTNLVKE
jgi:hypothetical protein